MSKYSRPLISLGSLKNIGYEIFLMSVKKGIFKKNMPVCIGSKANIGIFIKNLKFKLKYHCISFDEFIKNNDIMREKFDFILIDTDDKLPGNYKNIGEISDKTDGICALNTIKKAAYLVLNGYFKSVITLPVNKKNINLTDKNFYGHTEFFQKLWHQSGVYMTFISNKINIMLLTTHIPLKSVSPHINAVNIKNILKASVKLKQKLELNKKTCFLGFNPHAGEGGIIGKEDLIIERAVKEFNKTSGSGIEGPVPSDTAFIGSNLTKYDLFISCYHDQGLIPFKMLSFKNGVNLSFGMDFIRTSVDHGTACGLIGSRKADITSFVNAYKTAEILAI